MSAVPCARGACEAPSAASSEARIFSRICASAGGSWSGPGAGGAGGVGTTTAACEGCRGLPQMRQCRSL
eukprot:1673246-Alexandrium_andersonii.AAC.1